MLATTQIQLCITDRGEGKWSGKPYKKAKRVHAREHGKVGRRGEPDLDVEEAAADLGPLEGFFCFEDWAR